MVIWITGLANAGKTTIGQHVFEIWRQIHPNTVLVDGDDVRRLFGLEKGEKLYSVEGRQMVAERICDMCAWLDRQEINVVCCTISLFKDLQKRNRDTFSQYFEVFIEVPMDVLRHRDQKNLYEEAQRGDIANVVGVDLPFDPPEFPDLVLDIGREKQDLKP